jgi:AbrB family looped-hinge helix DNA binding protein
MKEVVASIDNKGRVVIPAEIRTHLGLDRGGQIVFVLEDDGRVELKGVKYPTVASLRGAAGKLAQPLSWEEMRQIAREDYLTENEL